MNQDLEKLFNQADKQLLELEAEACAKEHAGSMNQEVDHEDSLRFNQPSVTRLSYPKRHPFQMVFLCMVLPLMAIQWYREFDAPRVAGPYHLVVGTVQSSAAVRSGYTHYGTVTASKVALPDGRVISVRVDSGRFLRVGATVKIRAYDTGAFAPDRSL